MTGRSLALSELAVLSLFVRKLPPGRNYLVACGLDDLLEGLESLSFGEREIAYLSGVGGACRWLTDRFTPSGRMPKRG